MIALPKLRAYALSATLLLALSPQAIAENSCAFSTLPPDKTQALSDIFLDNQATYGVVGQAVAILKNDELVYRNCSGLAHVEFDVPVTQETVFPIYSVSKLFFNMAFIDLIEAGKVKVASPLSDYLDDLPDDWAKVTVLEAWTHISGLPEIYQDDMADDVEEALTALKDAPMAFETGTETRYNQTNFLLLKRILEKFTGQAYQTYMESRFKDAGLKSLVFGGDHLVVPMLASSYQKNRSGEGLEAFIGYDYKPYLYASAGLNGNIADLTKWAQSAFKRDLHSYWQPIARKDGSIGPFSHGFDMRKQQGITRVGHSGGNRNFIYQVFADANPDETITLIFVQNGGLYDIQFSIFADQLAAQFIPDALSPTDALSSRMLKAFIQASWDTALKELAAFEKTEALLPQEREAFINRFGYDVMWRLGPAKAAQVFAYNVANYPTSANAYDSLGEATRAQGDLRQAHRFYSQALKLDPSNSRIAETIEKITRLLTD